MTHVTPARPRLALALARQGGGAHGTDGWGIPERLLDEDVDIVVVSEASPSALNGTALVAGLASASKIDTRRTQIEEPRATVRATAEAWLAENLHAFGRASTLTDLTAAVAA